MVTRRVEHRYVVKIFIKCIQGSGAAYAVSPTVPYFNSKGDVVSRTLFTGRSAY